ncbi:MAG: SPOR domain-containing protein [Shimia sp.]
MANAADAYGAYGGARHGYGGGYGDGYGRGHAPRASQAAPEEAGTGDVACGAHGLVTLLGGVVSLALIAGVGVWGYQMLARDVSGVPVVQALDGPMRMQPPAPGGRQASNQGLAVNAVAATGTSAAPGDRLVLAPGPEALATEDTPARVLAVRPSERPAQPAAPSTPAATVGASGQSDILALADRLASGATPFGEVAPVTTRAPAIPELAAASGGLSRSVRPAPRPVRAATAAAPVAVQPLGEALAAAVQSPRPAAPAGPAIQTGDRLVQLGAFDSPAVAEAEWGRLQARFRDILVGKTYVVQRASNAGRTFYRLRAVGFDGLDDARRFCSVLRAQNAPCIPVRAE